MGNPITAQLVGDDFPGFGSMTPDQPAEKRWEGAMARFRDIKSLQKFTAVHSSTYNHFNNERNLNRRQIFKQLRAAALVEWRELAA